MILLTGATGFIGSHLLKNLISEYGAENVIAYTRTQIEGVICAYHNNYNQESFSFSEIGPEKISTIIHAGASTPKNKLQADNTDLANANIFVTKSLLNANLPNLKRFIYLSTVDVYAEAKIINEATSLLPANAYAKSKLYSEKLVANWARTHGYIGQILRIGHVYGPGQESYNKIIPSIMRCLIDGQTIKIYGSGSQRRSFIYVKDVVKAIMTSLNLKDDIGPVNITGNIPVSINTLVNLMAKISTVDPIIEILSHKEEGDIVFDSIKMKKYLLNDEISLEDGLTLEWKYTANKLNENSH